MRASIAESFAFLGSRWHAVSGPIRMRGFFRRFLIGCADLPSERLK